MQFCDFLLHLGSQFCDFLLHLGAQHSHISPQFCDFLFDLGAQLGDFLFDLGAQLGDFLLHLGAQLGHLNFHRCDLCLHFGSQLDHVLLSRQVLQIILVGNDRSRGRGDIFIHARCAKCPIDFCRHRTHGLSFLLKSAIQPARPKPARGSIFSRRALPSRSCRDRPDESDPRSARRYCSASPAPRSNGHSRAGNRLRLRAMPL